VLLVLVLPPETGPPPPTVPSVTVMGATPGGSTMLVDGGMMLCTGVMTPVVGSSGWMVTGQKGIELMVNGCILMTVVIVTVELPLSE
jgi:hypothetical protein